MKAPAQRTLNLPGNFFAALEARITEMQNAGREVIRLDIGSPDLAPSPEIINSLVQSAQQPGHHGYQPHVGPQALRQAWAETYHRLHQVELDPRSEILPLLGSKEGIFNFSMAWVDPGDVVLVPDPGYMTYTRGALFAGGQPYFFPLLPEKHYLPDLQAIPGDILKRAKLLWLNYPNNPTAAVATLDFFEQAVAFARQHDLLLCHDAAYTQVTFDGFRAPSILEVPGARQVAVEFNSLSKAYNMAGWRAAALVGNAQAIQPLFRVKTNLDSGHFLPVLHASIAALRGDQSWLAERNAQYQQRRDLVVEALRRIHLPVETPLASIYVWSPVPAGWKSADFVSDMLEKTGVSLTPGTIFGERGEGFVRIGLTTDTPQLAEAMRRLATWR